MIISHQERILQIADEVVVLADGKIRQQGPRDEILPGLIGTASAVAACRKSGVDLGKDENFHRPKRKESGQEVE